MIELFLELRLRMKTFWGERIVNRPLANSFWGSALRRCFNPGANVDSIQRPSRLRGLRKILLQFGRGMYLASVFHITYALCRASQADVRRSFDGRVNDIVEQVTRAG